MHEGAELEFFFFFLFLFITAVTVIVICSRLHCNEIECTERNSLLKGFEVDFCCFELLLNLVVSSH